MGQLDWTVIGYDIGVEFVAAFLVAVAGVLWATWRRSHRLKALVSERILGVVRTIRQLAEQPPKEAGDEAKRAEFFIEFIERQMDAELNDRGDLLSDKQRRLIEAFRDSVRNFRNLREDYQRRSRRFWEAYNTVVERARGAIKALGALNRRTRHELDDLRKEGGPQ